MTKLITSAQVVSLAFDDVNLYTSKIKDAHIYVAQEEYLRPLLGQDFYDDMIAKSEQSPYSDLITNYLIIPLAYFVKYVALPELTISVSSLGMNLVQPEGTIAATDRQAGLMREQAMDVAKALMDKAIRYIEDNETTFTEYNQADTVKSETKVLGGIIF